MAAARFFLSPADMVQNCDIVVWGFEKGLEKKQCSFVLIKSQKLNKGIVR